MRPVMLILATALLLPATATAEMHGSGGMGCQGGSSASYSAPGRRRWRLFGRWRDRRQARRAAAHSSHQMAGGSHGHAQGMGSHGGAMQAAPAAGCPSCGAISAPLIRYEAAPNCPPGEVCPLPQLPVLPTTRQPAKLEAADLFTAADYSPPPAIW